MTGPKVLLSAMVACASASPFLPRDVSGTNSTNTTSPFVYTNSFGLNFTQMNASLPNVTIFATGGTIAGTDSSSVATSGYAAGQLGVLELVNAVPQILDVANVAGVQVANVGSEDVTSAMHLQMAHEINKVVCGDPTMSGAVITHGTDTLEETSFFIDATVNCGKPVVVVGAMRPATAVSADGPFNLLEAVTVAASPLSRNRGALVVFNDRIVSAYYATKINANTLDTFKAPEMGNLGELISDIPYYFYPPVTPTGKTAFDVSNVEEIPRVDILFSYQDMSNDTLFSAIKHGAKGIVYAGAGAGGVSSNVDSAINFVVNKHKIPVVNSFRSANGEVPDSDIGNSSSQAIRIPSGYLNPQKSRILLGLLLAEKKNLNEIRDVFLGSTDD
ncbi:L-asparaginase, type II [Penicillium occitanis (nom. inval.)]|nr:L-asparaginase, type II [Penicillium occitanis (nom. inval.)]PCG88960.1 hypothetical protein PENOC_108660 [Penicillium occitanis (nom. inval.)]